MIRRLLISNMKGRGRGRGETPLVKASKKLSWALRHGIHELGLSLNPAGYVRLNDLLAHPQFSHMNTEFVQQIVAEDNKQRYGLVEQEGELWIRANQGHTVTDVQDEQLLEEIKDPNQFPFIVHGTDLASWEEIQYRGLYRMNRNHIHFAVGLPGAGEVISGARVNCQVFIQVDMAAAMQDGLRFFVSANRVVLSSGRFGFISPQYFKKVWVSGVESEFRWMRVEVDYFLVLDFEANCTKTGKLACQEIIEWPVLVVNARTKRVEHRFHTYVQPVVEPLLRDFCTELTGIRQEQVANAPDLPAVLSLFHQFLTEKQLLSSKFVFATCGDWDLHTCLPSECSYKKLQIPEYMRTWINVKMLFPVKAGGMIEMLEILRLPHQGRHHSGIDDAENIANALISLLEAGISLSSRDIHILGMKPGRPVSNFPLTEATKVQKH